MNYKLCTQRIEMETAKCSKQDYNNNFSTRQYIISNYVMSRLCTMGVNRNEFTE